MKGIINFFKTLYRTNKILFFVVIIVALFFLAGCSSQSGSAPSGPVGGGCGQ